MINSIELNGFKSFVADELTLGNLTLLTGLNSSGKSSVIQALLLLRKVADGQEIYLEGHGDIKESTNAYSKDGIEISAYFDKNHVITLKNKDRTASSLIASVHFPEIIYISADRFGPETSIPIHIATNKLGKKGENVLQCINAYADYILDDLLKHEKSEGDTFLFNLNAWLGVISPNVKFKHTIQTISDSSYSTFNGHRAKNVGFGLSYALPVITALLLGSVTPNSIVLVENPEAHLHPRGQTEMARLISLCVESGVQVLVETHSDHLFDGIRIHAKNNKDNFYEKVKIYWLELDKKGNTDVQEAALDENGRIDNWPQGLFDQFQINASKLL
jgi:predicted ATPase